MTQLVSAPLVYKNKIGSAPELKFDRLIAIPYFYAYTDHIVIFPRKEYKEIKSRYNDKSKVNLKAEKFQGKISTASQRIIKQRLTAWLTSIIDHNNQPRLRFKRKEHYPIFITLTLADQQFTSDNDIKRKMLGEFIKNIKRHFNIENYYWRAERQKNGNLHFHIITDKFIGKDKIQTIWNRIQKNNGYLVQFEKKYNHSNPPSTHVKGIQDVGNFVEYVLKYMLKDEKHEKVEGRIYGLSDSLRNLKTFASVLDSNYNELISEAIENQELKVYQGEYFTILYFTDLYKYSRLRAYLQEQTKIYYLELYDKIYKTKQEPEKEILKPKPKPKEESDQLNLELNVSEISYAKRKLYL